MLEGRSAWRSVAAGADSFRRAVSKDAACGTRKRYAGASPGASELAHGQSHHNRFRNDDEQRLRGYRGALAFWNAAGADRRRDSSAVDDSFDGGIRGWFSPGTTWTHGYAHAHPICVNLSTASGIEPSGPGLVETSAP